MSDNLRIARRCSIREASDFIHGIEKSFFGLGTRPALGNQGDPTFFTTYINTRKQLPLCHGEARGCIFKNFHQSRKAP